MILEQDPKTGYWDKIEGRRSMYLTTHNPEECVDRLCDVHDRRGTGAQATWPLNWRDDRGIMEVICPCGIGHPTPAQIGYWETILEPVKVMAEYRHGCCLVHCPSRSFDD